MVMSSPLCEDSALICCLLYRSGDGLESVAGQLDWSWSWCRRWVTMYPYESSCAVSWWYAALVSHVWQSWVSLEILSCLMSEGVQVRIAWSVALEKLADDREEARHTSSALGLPRSH